LTFEKIIGQMPARTGRNHSQMPSAIGVVLVLEFWLKLNLTKVPNEASCAWEPNLINFPILGKKMVKIEKLGNQKA
jgi:hypothetical protein